MARIEHRRYVRPYANTGPTPSRNVADLVDDDVLEPGPAAVAAKPAPFASLDNLTWLGWGFGVAAFAVLVFSIRSLFHAGAFGGSERNDDILTLVEAVAAMAAVALPAAIERGAANARQRAPRLYLAAVLLALAELGTLGVQQLRQNFLSDVDFSDPTQPIVLGYFFLSLVPVLLSLAGLWAMVFGVWQLGAPRAIRLLAVAGIVAAVAYFLTYVPDIGAILDPAAGLVFWLNLIRVVVTLALTGSTAAAGVALMAGAVGNLAPRMSWGLVGLAGAGYFLSALGRVVLGTPISQDAQITLGWFVFALDAATPVFLLFAFATGIARSVDPPSPARRVVARWVRYPVA